MKQNLREGNGNVNSFFTKNPDAYYFNANGEIRCQSVHGKSRNRFEKARLESEKSVVSIEEIINHVNDFFSIIGITKVENPKMSPDDIDYEEIKDMYCLEDEKELIWMKFTDDGYLAVVAQSNDINFDIPDCEEDYDKKRENGEWLHTTSGILIHKLHKRWDTSFVLVFPLHRERCTYDRHDIETAVGNFLIANGIPILDYYSHNF